MSLCDYSRGGSKKYVLNWSYIDDIPFTSPVVINTEWCVVGGNGIMIYKGYEWDGPSGPTIDTDDFMDGSLVHDALYQLIREGELGMGSRKAADECLFQMCRADSMPLWRARYVYFFVRMFGKSSAIV
jgi:hypothetical protein